MATTITGEGWPGWLEMSSVAKGPPARILSPGLRLWRTRTPSSGDLTVASPCDVPMARTSWPFETWSPRLTRYLLAVPSLTTAGGVGMTDEEGKALTAAMSDV